MVFKDTFEDRWPLNFWDAVGNLFWAWSPLVLNHRRDHKL